MLYCITNKCISASMLALILYAQVQGAASGSSYYPDFEKNTEHAVVQRDSSGPIRAFMPCLWGHVYQGFVAPWSSDPVRLAAIKHNTEHLSRKNSTKLSLRDKEAYDWVHCLNQITVTGLGAKKFQTWTVHDLKRVNAMLTRLQSDNPGEFRISDITWSIRELSHVDQIRLDMLQRQITPFTEEDKKFLEEAKYVFPPAEHVPAAVAKMLADVKKAFDNLAVDSAARAIHDEINIASYVHHQIVAIHPWHDANKRTGRLLSYIILMQHGIIPPVYPDAKKYTSMFLENLKDNDYSPLSAYTRDLIVARQSGSTITN